MPRNPDKIDYSGGLPEQLKAFDVIEDPRTGGNTKHHFGEVLFISVVGLLCGMNTCADIEDFAHLQRDWFNKWLELPNGIPRSQTFSNIFAIIDSDKFAQCLILHLSSLSPQLASQVIALDGKTLRGSKRFNEEAAHVVSAWAAEEGLTLAREFVTDKSNEITAIPRLLELIDLEGHTVTIDAMGTQVEIAQAIIDRGGDYILALKGNQGNLHKEVIDHIDFSLRQLDLKTAKGWTSTSEVEKEHGRLTTRSLIASSSLDTLDSELCSRWAGLASIIVVENQTIDMASGKKRKPERRYYISSLKEPAEELLKKIRLHWSIENQCHWVLDVVFREDHNQTTGNAAKNLSTLRSVVLNILKSDKSLKVSLPKKRRHAAFDHDYREKLLSLA